MELNDLLRIGGFDPKTVLVFRHRPPERLLQRHFTRIAGEFPELFNAYQRTQGPAAETMLSHATHVASCIGLAHAQEAVFIGLYRVGKSCQLARSEYWHVSEYAQLREFGMEGLFEDAPERDSCLFFDLELLPFYQEWKGKLVIGWPAPALSWKRWAGNNRFPVLTIQRESLLAPVLISWDQLVLHWQDLRLLPQTQRSAMQQWRGIYYIFDSSDGRGYVGAAYGADNILGRWLSYAESGDGGNQLLKLRNAENFRFSILQLVAPSLAGEDVIALETNWKERLHTRAPDGLNAN